MEMGFKKVGRLKSEVGRKKKEVSVTFRPGSGNGKYLTKENLPNRLTYTDN